MKRLYFHMSDLIMLFYISLSGWPNINKLFTIDREKFSVFRLDYWIQNSGHLMYSY